MKIYAMSDIHGCLQEFEAALELIDLSDDNKLVHVEENVIFVYTGKYENETYEE